MNIRNAFKALGSKDEDEVEQLAMPMKPKKKKKKKKKQVKHGSYFRKHFTDYDEMLEEAYGD